MDVVLPTCSIRAAGAEFGGVIEGFSEEEKTI